MIRKKRNVLKTSVRVLKRRGVVHPGSGNEPMIDAQAISASWGIIWPKVIARAWMVLDKIEEAKKKGKWEVITERMKAGDRETDLSSFIWYFDLTSLDPERVRKALIAVGFAPEIRYANSKDDPSYTDLTWFWSNLRIIVKERGDGILIDSTKDEESLAPYREDEENENPYPSVPKKDDFADESGNEAEYKYSEPELKPAGNVDHDSTTEDWEYIPKNGWKDVEGLEHVLVLTIPPKPPGGENMAMALAEYEATGRVYPFTFCC